MRKSLQRKTVYGVTIIAMLAVAGGFALASTGFNFAPTSTQGQNGYSVTTGPTIWTFASATASVDPNNACSASPQAITIVTPGTSPAAAVISVAVASGGACANTNLAEEFAFSGTVITASTSDIFTVFSYTATTEAGCATPTASANTMTVTTSGGSATATTVTADLWVDYGSAANVALCSVDISVAGS